MKDSLRPTRVVDHELLDEALKVAEAVGREKDRDRRTALVPGITDARNVI
jgi:hypothetical protein